MTGIQCVTYSCVLVINLLRICYLYNYPSTSTYEFNEWLGLLMETKVFPYPINGDKDYEGLTQCLKGIVNLVYQ